MTATELRAAQQTLGLSDEALAAELAVAPDDVVAWRTDARAIPKKHAQNLRWRAAIAERQAALEASGLPACAWVQSWEDRPVPEETEAMTRHFEALNTHGDSCATCTARTRFIEERFGPMPPAPSLGAFVGALALLDKLPAWSRPAAAGAAVLGAIVGLRLLFVLPWALGDPAQLARVLLALVAAMGAGAAGGLAYSLTRPALRRLGRPGDYLTGIVCVFAYMGALILVAPIAFGERIVEDRAGLVIFAAVAMFFGLVIGHSWFRADDTSVRAPDA